MLIWFAFASMPICRYFQNHAAEKFFGSWRLGELHGKGNFANPRGDTYTGYWQYNMRHGRGREIFKNRGTYKGYFVTNFRSGKGELEYGKRKKPKLTKPESMNGEDGASLSVEDRVKLAQELAAAAAELKKIPDHKYRYQGYFIANAIATGGITSDTMRVDFPKAVAKRDKKTTYPILSLFNKMERTYKEFRRKVEKFTDLEWSIRQVCLLVFDEYQ